MPTQTIIDNPMVTLWFHPETKIVHHQLHRFIAGAPFRELLLTGSELLRKHRAQKWLSDDRSNSALRQDDLEWSEKEWAPQTARAGWKYWAVVNPSAVLGQVTMERLTEKYAKLGVTAKVFSDPVVALAWLEKQ